jgi:uncharacterized repeat protein (TIGR04052 family)
MKPINQICITLLATSVLAACSSNDDDPAPSRAVTIPFVAEANGTPIECGATLTGLGTTDASATVLDFRFYVHDVTLISSTGARYPVSLDDNDFQGEGVALLDFQDVENCTGEAASETNFGVTGTVAAASSVHFDALEFTIGVPAPLNHSDPADAPGHLQHNLGLHWTWQGGYKHMGLDVAPIGGAQAAVYFHLGSTGCSPNPDSVGNSPEGVTCERINRPIIALDSFDPDEDAVLIDYGVLMQNSDILAANAGGPPGCMSGRTDPECDEVFAQLGMDITTTDTEEDYHVTQSVFSVQ